MTRRRFLELLGLGGAAAALAPPVAASLDLGPFEPLAVTPDHLEVEALTWRATDRMVETMGWSRNEERAIILGPRQAEAFGVAAGDEFMGVRVVVAQRIEGL